MSKVKLHTEEVQEDTSNGTELLDGS